MTTTGKQPQPATEESRSRDPIGSDLTMQRNAARGDEGEGGDEQEGSFARHGFFELMLVLLGVREMDGGKECEEASKRVKERLVWEAGTGAR
jgi:hypothetical protein